MAIIIKSPVAKEIPIEDTGNLYTSVNVEDALQESISLAQGTSKGYLLYFYNGNANSGRYLEFFSGISSNDAPLYTDTNITITNIVSRTVGTSATCTIGFYDISAGLPGTLLHTTTFSNNKAVIETNQTGLFTVTSMGELAIKIDSGSIQKPHCYLVLRGS